MEKIGKSQSPPTPLSIQRTSTDPSKTSPIKTLPCQSQSQPSRFGYKYVVKCQPGRFHVTSVLQTLQSKFWNTPRSSRDLSTKTDSVSIWERLSQDRPDSPSLRSSKTLPIDAGMSVERVCCLHIVKYWLQDFTTRDSASNIEVFAPFLVVFWEFSIGGL